MTDLAVEAPVQPETAVLVLAQADIALPEGRRFWTEPEMFPVTTKINKFGKEEEVLPEPSFTVQEVAKFFFGKGPDWLRWRARPNKTTHPKGYFVLDGKVLEPSRTQAGFRYYTLADVERMAHALAQTGAIDGQALVHAVVMVKHCALINDIDLGVDEDA